MNSRCACFLISCRYHKLSLSVTMRWTRRQESKEKKSGRQKRIFYKKIKLEIDKGGMIKRKRGNEI